MPVGRNTKRARIEEPSHDLGGDGTVAAGGSA
jgi:hypothetical protein